MHQMKILIKIFFIILILILSKKINAKSENKILFSISNEIFTSIDLNNRLNYINIKESKLIEYDDGILNDFISVLLFNKYYEEKNIKKDYGDLIDIKLKEIKHNINLKNDEKLNKILKQISEKEIQKNIIYDFKRKVIIENELQKKSELIFNNNIDKINNIYEIDIRLISLNNQNTYEIKKETPLNQIIEDLKKKKIDYLYIEKKLNFTEKINSSLKISIINNSNYFYINNMIYGEIVRKIKDEESIKFSIFQIKTDIDLSSDDLVCKKIENLSNKKINIIENKNVPYKNLNEIIKQNLIKINDYVNVKDNNKNNYILLCEIYYEDKIFENINTNNKINFLASKIEKNIKIKLSKKYKFKYL